MWWLLLVAFPIVEIWLLVVIGGRIGFWPTVAFVVGVGFVGGLLARAEGARVVRGMQTALREGRAPEEGLVGGFLVLVGGVLLVMPGILSDVAGLLLLFPPTRRLAGVFVTRWVAARIASGAITVHRGGPPRDDGRPPPPRNDDDDVIDV